MGTREDVERWFQRGIISRRQADAILISEGLLEKRASRERAEGLNLVTVAYYTGTFLALFAYTIFIGREWDRLNAWQQFAACLASIVIAGGLGILLRSRTGYPVAGALLIFVAAGILPLFFYTVEKAFGIWPSGPEPVFGGPTYHGFWREIRMAWIYLDIASIVGTGLVLWWTQFPLITLLVANFIWFLSLDISRLVTDPQEWFSRPQVLVTLGICAPMALLGSASFRRGLGDYGFWFQLFGLIGTFGALNIVFFEDVGSALIHLVYIAAHLGMLALSVVFQQRTYLVFGAVGIYVYLTWLVFERFGREPFFPLVLAVLGISVVLVAVLYQRYGDKIWTRVKRKEVTRASQP